jgi:hypothetical protein
MDDNSLPTTPMPSVKTSSHHDQIRSLIMSPKSAKRMPSVKTITNIENELDPTYRHSMTQPMKSTSKPPFEIPITPLKSPNRQIDTKTKIHEVLFSPNGKALTNFRSNQMVLPSPIFSPESTRKLPLHNNDLITEGNKTEVMESRKSDNVGAVVLAIENHQSNQTIRVQQLLEQISSGLATVRTAA